MADFLIITATNPKPSVYLNHFMSREVFHRKFRFFFKVDSGPKLIGALLQCLHLNPWIKGFLQNLTLICIFLTVHTVLSINFHSLHMHSTLSFFILFGLNLEIVHKNRPINVSHESIKNPI